MFLLWRIRECSKNYHIKYNLPSKDNVCDECSGDLYQRGDDKEDTIKNRLEVYHAQTKPLVDYYNKVIFNINAGKNIQEVSGQIKELLK